VESGAIQRCVLAGFPDHVAMRLDSGTLRCALVHGRKGVLARESVVADPLLVASEIREVEIRGDVETLFTLATSIREEWLRELFPSDFSDRSEVTFDTSTRRVVARRLVRFHDLILKAEPMTDAPPGEAAKLLAEELVRGESLLKAWDSTVEQWITRVNAVAARFPDYSIPPIGRAERQAILEQICYGAFSYKEVKERAVWPTLKSWLSPMQAQLIEDYAPARFVLPGGRTVKVQYSSEGLPSIAARIQDLFDVGGELRIGKGRLSLAVQVLAPNQRPVQITSDLRTFWKETYPQLKKGLQRKYPKHEWR